jgi:hypothetical protein
MSAKKCTFPGCSYATLSKRKLKIHNTWHFAILLQCLPDVFKPHPEFRRTRRGFGHDDS